MSEIDWSKVEGAEYWGPENADYTEAYYKLVDGKWFFVVAHNDWDWESPEGFEVSGKRLSQMIKRHVEPEWSGDGLPPVGIECEDDAGNEVVIVAHHVNGVHAIFAESLEAGLLYYGAAGDFRPIRTPEQIAAEERENAVKEMETVAAKAWRETQIGMDMITEICSALYDAGFQVPKQ